MWFCSFYRVKVCNHLLKFCERNATGCITAHESSKTKPKKPIEYVSKFTFKYAKIPVILGFLYVSKDTFYYGAGDRT